MKEPKNHKYKYTRVRRVMSLNKGFTLIELVVAVGVFAVVMVVAAGSLLSIIDVNKKAHALRVVMDNLNFSLSSMTRFIRTGTNYHCGSSGTLDVPQDCSSGDSFLALKSQSGDIVTYRLNNNRIERRIGIGVGDQFVGVTSDQIFIDRLRFYVWGSGESDEQQPRVLILVSGYVGGGRREESRFNIQTTVSQRELDS